MAELKTKKTAESVESFINKVEDEEKRRDSYEIIKMMEKIGKAKPKMWGSAIVGFVDTKLIYESGRELDWFKLGFSPRKQALTLYGLISTPEQAELLKKLGKTKTGKGCLYIKKLSDVDTTVLKKMIELGFKRTDVRC